MDEGLLVDGPALTVSECLYTGAGTISLLEPEPGLGSPGGFLVRFGRVEYRLALSDFDRELHLSRAELFLRDGNLASRFFFAVSGGGDTTLSISALLDGQAAPTDPGWSGHIRVTGGRPSGQPACARALFADAGVAETEIDRELRTCEGHLVPTLVAGRESVRVFGFVVEFVSGALRDVPRTCTDETRVEVRPRQQPVRPPRLHGDHVEEFDVLVDGQRTNVVRLESSVPGVLALTTVELFRRFQYVDLDVVLAARREGVVHCDVISPGESGEGEASVSWYIEVIP